MPHMEGIFINGEKAKFHPEDILDTDASQYTEEIGESVSAFLTEHLTNPSNPPIDTSLSIAGAAADAKETGNKLTQLKSEFTALTYDGAVPSAEQILSDKGVTDSVPYHHRKTGGDGADRLYDQIVGGSVAWNQLAKALVDGNYNKGPGTAVYDNGTVSFTAASQYGALYCSTLRPLVNGYKYLINSDIKLTNVAGNNTVRIAIGHTGYSQGTIYIPSTSPVNTFINVSGVVQYNPGTDPISNNVFLQDKRAEASQIDMKNLMLFDLTAMFGSTIADHIYALEQATAGAGVALFKSLFPKDYYAYDAGSMQSVSGLSEHRTVGFNCFNVSTIETGYIDDSDGVKKSASSGNTNCSDYIKVVPNNTYYINTEQTTGAWGAWYDSEKKFISGFSGYIATAVGLKYVTAPANAEYMRLTVKYNGNGDPNTVCINLSDPAKNGEYEPYKAHSYPLDPTLILRGVPQLVDGKIKWDGDTYDADGTVTRRYGVVDLGTLIWTKSTDYANPIFYAGISDLISGVQDKKLVCTNYVYAVGLSAGTVADYTTPVIGTPAENTQVIVRDPNHDSSDAATFKAAMSGVMLVYRLATPTTEQADPYQHLQQCDPNGMEEYVSTGIVPVGHNSFYPENLRAKVEQLPWNFASLIAPTEATFTATQNYTTGALFIVNNVLYKATSNIANGGTITPNTNCTATTLAEIISALA